jgi:hypothetical protein
MNLSDITQTHSWPETIGEPARSEAKAFCGHCFNPKGPFFSVRGLASVRSEIRGGVTDCPKCGHALFWSRHYQEVGLKWRRL